MKRIMMSEDREKGAILMVTMMILLVLTVFGIAAISTTTSEMRIAGNARMQSMFFYGADGGTRTYVPILGSIMQNHVLPAAPLGSPVQDSNLGNELLGTAVVAPPDDGATDSPTNRPDLSMTAGDVTVGIDIDRIDSHQLSGGAGESHSGYEGTGASLVSGGVGIYFQVDSVGGILGGSQSQVSNVYIHHVQ